MRSAKQGGLCGHCGIESDDGLYWENNPKVLDFGMPGIPPIEPDMTVPTLCDDCNTRHTVFSAYNDNPVLAQRIYYSRTPQGALEMMGVPVKAKGRA